MYSIKTKISSILATFWKLQKLIPIKKNQSVIISKTSSPKTQKIAIPQKTNSCKNFVPHGWCHFYFKIMSHVCDVINKETFLFCYLVKSFNSDYSLICHFVSSLSQWLIKHHDAYFIFHVIGAALIRERRLLQLRVKHGGECRENSELGKKKNKCVQLEPLYELHYKKVSPHSNLITHKLVMVLLVKQYGFDISLYQAP